jgi:MYXO-CTERM domain-containing protein
MLKFSCALGTLSLLFTTGAAFAQSADPNVAANFDFANNWVRDLAQPTDIAFLADGRAVILQKQGKIIVRRTNGTLRDPAAMITVDFDSEKGLLGVDTLVDWRTKSDGSEAQRTIFLYISNGPNGGDKHRVFRAVVQADDSVVLDANPLVSGGLEGPANHDGGTVRVYNNQLYISVGDTGANNNDPQNKYGSCLNKPNGKILRVALNGMIPADNPLVGVALATSCGSPTGAFGSSKPDERVFAWGFRNPFRFWVDPMTGLVWVGDVGEGTREEITVVRNGEHHGFPFQEGTRANPRTFTPSGCSAMSPSKPCTAPVYDYGHADGNVSVTGGLIPDDSKLCGWPDAYKGRYFFGDYGSGRVWTVPVANRTMGTVTANAVTEFRTGLKPVSFKMGPDDALYIVNHTGAITKVSPKGRNATLCANNAGTGGAGGTANTGGAGGATGGAGGTPARTGGAGGTAMATGGTGGNPSNSGGTTGNTAGTSGTAGSSGNAGNSGNAGDNGAGAGNGNTNDKADSGCGCRLSGRGEKGGSLLLLGLVAGWMWRRRRVR